MLISLLLALQAAVAAPVAQAPLSAPVPIERQILWQRSLEDALAISAAEKRPILVAVNMDGESASENIVRERYRDPKFVALTRRFVCLGASAFRHGERDHSYDGHRLVSPRLGEITSGEAIALEPILFDKYLGGERIAPRHALILLDGKKVFDHFQLFDLRELDKALADAQELAPAAASLDLASIDAARLTPADWLRLASAKDNRQRGRFEALLFAPAPIEQVETALGALAEVADQGSLEALRIAFARAGEAPGRLAKKAVFVAAARSLQKPTAALVREMLTDVPGASAKTDPVQRAELLDALAALDGSAAMNRSLLLSYAVAGAGSQERARASHLCAGTSESELSQAITAGGGGIDPARVLAACGAIAREEPWRAPDELAPAEELEAELQAADENLAANPDSAPAQVRFGKAALSVARSRIESKTSGVELLLGDAQSALIRAVGLTPADVSSWLLLARTCYLNSDFAGEERAALGALAALPPLDPAAVDRLLGRAEASATQLSNDAQTIAEPRDRLEGLRWLADACARQLGTLSGADLAAEATNMARGYNAAALTVLAPISTATDWLTLSAFHAALGRRSEEIAVARAGLDLFPESQDLRTAFYLAVWERGYSTEARRQSEIIADRHPESGVARWYVGYAAMHEADTLRRGEDPRAAIAAYQLADKALLASVQITPSFEDSASFYRALAALGSGFAHLLLNERTQAALRLVAGIAIRPSIAEVRDALDREAIDLLDGVLEWRASGASPVDALALATDLGRADPGNPNWARRISDSELREGLRADGRHEAPELGDRYLVSSIAIARLAVAASPEETIRRTLAQSLTVHAERLIARADLTGARPLLSEAAGLAGERAPASGASDGEWIELAARLRAQLGDARPIFRPGR
ncbi:MAG TPA: hypothetical protein VK843_07705 [Planctomycetota bacterium]|nr:hypothetical protein [Planctomycetota bacterium]